MHAHMRTHMDTHAHTRTPHTRMHTRTDSVFTTTGSGVRAADSLLCNWAELALPPPAPLPLCPRLVLVPPLGG